MPVLNKTLLKTQNLPNGQFGFSATRLDNLGAAEYTLVTIVNDVSPSVDAFVSDMEKALQEIVKACKYSPRADNLLVRLVTFAGTMAEAHGFKLLEECDPANYRGLLRIGSATALYDAAANAIQAATAYGKQLTDAHFGVNAIAFLVTDGMDNASRYGVQQVRRALLEARQGEGLESILSILVGVNVKEPQVSQYLHNFRTEAGFDQYVELNNANASSLAKLARFMSQSISAQSQALGTGGPSQSLTF